jgi:DNA-binding NtrC family response regulator
MDLPLSQQAKLLRAIEEQSVTRLGETTPRPVDVRVVAASQRSLAERVERGLFREDLLARLCGVTVHLPPLAERREEVPRLFSYFFREAGGDPARLRSSLIEALCLHRWPLNVREVAQAARRAVLVESTRDLAGEHAPEILQQPSTEPPSLQGTSTPARAAAVSPVLPAGAPAGERIGQRRWAWLRRHWGDLQSLLDAMRRNGGNVSAAARETGISRQRAQRLLEAKAGMEGDQH